MVVHGLPRLQSFYQGNGNAKIRHRKRVFCWKIYKYSGRELDAMTIPERMLTQLANVCSLTRVMRGGRHRCIRSHCVVFDATPGPPVTLLPRSVDELDSFRVALVGDFTSDQIAKVRRMHTIRRRVVSSAFDFYKDHNHLYNVVNSSEPGVESCEVESEVDRDDEKGDDNADVLFDIVDDNGSLETESNREQENIRGQTDNVAVSAEEEVEVVERRTGLLDDTSAMSISSIVDDASTEGTADKVRDFLVKRSNHFCDDATQTIYARMFPHLFPFGRGHPGEQRQVPASLRECIKHYTQLSSRRFAEDELFVLVAFDRIAMQNMYTQTSFRCQRFPNLFEGYDKIDTDSLAKVLLMNERARQSGSTSRKESEAVVDRFLKTVDIASCAVWGSNAERMQCRRQAFAYQTRYGQPALFVTLTPNTDNSLMVAHYAGITHVKSAFDLLAAKMPSKAELRQASLGNDCISTRLFMRAIDAFIQHALGIDPKTKKTISEGGLFGQVQAYFGMIETQGRGTLHVHFLIWLLDAPPNSVEIEKMLLNADGDGYRESVKEYAKSIVSNELPLPVEDGKCRCCGSSYSKLNGLPIDPHCRQDPIGGLYSTEAKRRVTEPLLVECGECCARFSSQHVLRQVLLEKRRLMPAWENHLTTEESETQAKVEAVARNTLDEAVFTVDERDRYYACISPDVIRETPDMTVTQVTEFLRSINTPSMLYCKADKDVFQNDETTRRIECTPPSPSDGRMSRSSLDYMVSVLVVLLNQHWWGHTGSCFKASRATQNDSYCRYMYPRDRAAEASFSSAGVVLPRKIAHEYINGFNYVMMATFKCNHDVQILLGGVEALDRIYYACKYVTKKQKRLDSVIPIAVAALKRRQDKEKLEECAESQGTSDRMARSRRRVTSMVYSMTNRQEIAGPLAALYLHVGTCCYSSSTCSKIPLGDMIRQLLATDEYPCQLVMEPTHGNVSRVSATAVSTLDDYIYRPKVVEKLSVYEFAMKYYRRQSEDPERSRFPFENGHPLARSHCLAVRRNDSVPLISGYKIPGILSDATSEDKAKHAIGSLVLFKSFRSLVDLVGQSSPSDETWIEAYSGWENQRSRFVVEIMQNMYDVAFARSKATEAALSHQFGWSENDESKSDMSSEESDDEISEPEDYGVDTIGDNSAMWDADVDPDEIFDSNDLSPAICPSCPLNGEHTSQIMETFSDTGILNNVAETTAKAFNDLDYDVDFPAVDYMKKWVRDTTTDTPTSAAAPMQQVALRDTRVMELFDEALETSTMQWNPESHSSNPEVKPEFATIATISSQFTLNRLQHAAFRKIGSALLNRWKTADDLNHGDVNVEKVLRENQLLFYLGGEGGTGKSRVIGAVQELCSSWRRANCLLKTALTGKAATLISGRTLAGFLLGLKSSKAGSTLGLDIVVIDEISMMYKSQLAELDQSLRKSTRNRGVPFGGIHIILVGDFLQLPPVGADPLYIPPWKRTRCSAPSLMGYQLWQSFVHVVILEECVRFQSDPEWGEGCRNARLGTWTPEFIDIINSRVVPQNNEEGTSPFVLNKRIATFVTPDNVTRQAINNLFIETAARCLPDGQYPVRIVANFKEKLKGLSRSDTEMVMRLPDNKFGRMAPFLDLIPGMPVQITQNVRPGKLVANGTLGTLEKIIYQPNTSFRLVHDNVLNVVVKIPDRPPQAVVVRLPRGPLAKPIGGDIDSDLFPVFYDCEPYKACEISLPTSNGEPRSLSAKISQFPLVCAVGSTIYKVQGDTLDGMIVTEWRSKVAIANKKEQPYLLVSRVTSRHAFATLEPMTLDIAAWAHPSQEALNEEARLKVLSDETVAALDA